MNKYIINKILKQKTNFKPYSLYLNAGIFPLLFTWIQQAFNG